MSFLLSGLIYNPAEAMLLLVFCYLFRDKKYKDVKFNFKKYLIHSYVLGFVFLLVQYPMNFINNSISYIIYNLFVIFMFMPAIMMIYRLKYKRILSLKNILFSQVYNNITVITLILLSSWVNTLIPIGNHNSLFIEFITNVLIKIVQFVLIFIISKVVSYEKYTFKDGQITEK